MANIPGTEGGDTLVDTSGNDTINAFGGDDRITLTGGTDHVDGGTGVDTLVLGWGAATTQIYNYSGPSENSGAGGWNGQFYGGSGAFYAIYTSIERFDITTGSGNDQILTKNGNDVVSVGSGNDVVDVGAGTDWADGGAGIDGISADASDATGAIVWDLVSNSFAGGPDSFANFEYFGTVTTGAGDDIITTGEIDRNETVNLGAGNDIAAIVRGTDRVNGGDGSDTLIINWSAATTTIYAYVGPTANDALGGWDGQFYGGSGSFYAYYSSIERFVITSGSGNDSIVTADGDDVVSTGAGNDSVDVRTGTDRADGGEGLDMISADLSDATGAIAWNLATNSFAGGPDSFTNFEFFGTITTGSGNDALTTGDINKDETLNLGAGDDIATIVRGTDRVNGGTGSDRLVIDWSAATASVYTYIAPTANAGQGGWDGQYYGGSGSFYTYYSSIEHFTITTGAGNDSLATANGDDVLNGGGGNDTLNAGAGNDILNGGDGTDTLNGETGDDAITMAGSTSGFDYVDGGAGIDTLTVDWSHLSTSVQDYTQPGYGDGLHSSGGGVTLVYRNIDRLVVTTGSGNDRFTTGTTDDTVSLGAGDDFVDLVTGADSADGGAGEDGLSVDLSTATSAVNWNLGASSYSGPSLGSIVNFEYFGVLTTGSGNDVVVTTSAVRNETINLGAGNDTATVGYGNDIVNGGSGFDTLIVDYSTVSGNISNFTGPDAGADGFSGIFHEPSTRRTDYTGIERFIITTGSGTDNITTASGDDEIRTGAGNDALNGGEGDDYLDGGAGADAMTGGRGSDTFVVDNAGDTTTEQAGQGIDTVETALAAYTLAANVENIAGAGVAQALTGNALNNGMLGTLGADTLSGGAGDDVVVGSIGADAIDGGEGRDILIAGLVDPTNLIVNGSFETQNGANSARQFILDGGSDYNGLTYRFASTLLGWSRSGAGGDIELNTYGTNGGFDRGDGSVVLDLETNAGENVSIYQDIAALPGGSALILSFAAGQGTGGPLGANPSAILEVVWNGVVIATIVSTSTAMTQHAFVVTASGTGEDRLEFREVGGGADARGTALDAVALNFIAGGFDDAANTLAGGAGHDTLIGDAGDDTLRGDQGMDLLVGGAGIDTVDYASESGDIALVNLSSATAFLGGIGLAAGTARDTHGFIDTLVGIENVTTGSGDDQVLGGSGANDISTGGGNDRLDGGEGADTLAGGTGDDTYTDNDAEADTITERENEGTDTVRTSQAVYSIAAIAHVENLAGTADTGQTLTGNAADNIISGAAGNDRLTGGAGNDTLNGNEGDDTLVYSGAGNDPAHGGVGMDTLVIDFSGATASVVDNPNASRFGFEASYWDQGANSVAFTSVERILITTGAFADTITTYGGDDEIRTGAGADTLNGGDGNDFLDGGSDADTMGGGSGNDIYIVDNLADVVAENEEAGTDEVRTALGGKASASALYVLAANVENLTGTSSSGQGVRGNALSNIITMGGGADLVVADDGGDDTIATGGGNDFIYYGGALTAQDSNNGGAGFDTIGLLGTYDLTLGATSLVGIEKLTMYTSGDTAAPNSYSITIVDAAVAAGETLQVVALSLAANEKLTFLGHDERDGAFKVLSGAGDDIIAGGLNDDTVSGGGGDDIVYTLAGNDTLLGGAGDDKLYGQGGNDTLNGGAGQDFLNGGLGRDTFVFTSAADSSGIDFDTIQLFDARVDKIDLPGAVAGWSGKAEAGQLSTASFDADLAAALDGILDANAAVLFRPTTGDFAGRTFAVIDRNGDGSYQAGTDLVIEFARPVVPIDTGTAYFI